MAAYTPTPVNTVLTMNAVMKPIRAPIHQPIEPPLATHRAPALALLGRTSESPDTGLAPTFVFHRLPARAPPTA